MRRLRATWRWLVTNRRAVAILAAAAGLALAQSSHRLAPFLLAVGCGIDPTVSATCNAPPPATPGAAP